MTSFTNLLFVPANRPERFEKAASSGADINGAAINNACDQMRARLAPVAARMLGCDVNAIKFIAGQAINTLDTALFIIYFC